MDLLTLKKAMAYAEQLVEETGGDVRELSEDLAKLAEGVDAGSIDKDVAFSLLLNAFRQHVWDSEENGPVCEIGEKALTNTEAYPFNNSQQTVALATAQKNTKYAVIARIKSAVGNAGDVVVSDRQVNGVKLAYTGSATSAVVEYIVIGGIIA
jgi:hypothetical protein